MEQFRKKIRNPDILPIIKLASDIRKFDQKRASLYREPKISLNKKSAEYIFGPVYMEEIGGDGKIQEIKSQIDPDEFIAVMWKLGIRFGLDMKNIKKTIQENKETRFTITEEKASIPGEDATIEALISFKKDS